jgi:hypothetical protein
MADDIKPRDNRDAEEGGRPVQLDREQPDGKTGEQDKKQRSKQGGQHGGQQGDKRGQQPPER